MSDYRVFIYANGWVLPAVVALNCHRRGLNDRLQRVFALDVSATRAEVWDGPTMVMQIDAGGIAALARLAEARETPSVEAHALH